MDRQEYQRRRRALEELYQTDLRLLRAAHEARIRSLEALWLDLKGDGEALPAASAILLPAAEVGPAAAPEPAEARSLPPSPPPPDVSSRSPDLRMCLESILPALPPVFDKKDIVQALGWTPSRSSLYRVLMELVTAGLLELENLSSGRTPSSYRKV